MKNQPIEIANDGVVRFKENKIVSRLLDIASQHGWDLNKIALEYYDTDDYIQLMQLIGYSVDGYCELGCVSNREANRAMKQAEKVWKERDDEG